MSAAIALPVDVNLSQLLISDEVYFRTGAEVRRLPDCELAFAPGLTGVPAGCVVQRVRFHRTPRQADAWIDYVEQAVREVGAPLCRIYLHSPHGCLSAALARRGYKERTELAFSASPLHLGIESRVRFHPATTDEDWAARRSMHERAPDNSDGYTIDPASWCELIRRKCATGVKESFLIEYQGRLCGSIGAIRMKDILRLKNILILPEFRRAGVGREAVRELAALTHRRNLKALTVFGIEGEAGSALYRRAGFSVIGWQTEWSKRL